MSHPTQYWHLLDNGRIQCDLCPRFCKLEEGQRGLCFVRARENDAIVLTECINRLVADGAADVVLLLLCASLCGAWTPVPGKRPEGGAAQPAPVPG